MPKWLKFVLRIISIIGFLAPIGHILIKYGITQQEEVTLIRTTGGLNMFWTLVIGCLTMVITFYIILGVFIKWKEKIKDNPFGEISRLTFGLFITTMLLIGIITLNYMLNFILTNTQGFIDVMTTYKSDFQYMMGYELVAVILNTVIILWKD